MNKIYGENSTVMVKLVNDYYENYDEIRVYVSK